MTEDNILLNAGQVIGILMRATVEEYEAAIACEGLCAEHRMHLRLVASWRRDLDVLAGTREPEHRPTK